MKRLFKAIAPASMILAGAQALAIVSVNHSSTHRRQMAACMVKRVSADRTVSYNEALNTCKMTTDILASNTPIRSVNGRYRGVGAS